MISESLQGAIDYTLHEHDNYVASTTQRSWSRLYQAG